MECSSQRQGVSKDRSYSFQELAPPVNRKHNGVNSPTRHYYGYNNHNNPPTLPQGLARVTLKQIAMPAISALGSNDFPA